MIFKQSSAPTGWTFVAEDNDRVLINTSTEADGGKTGGSWTIGLSVDGHSLSVSEIPSHSHTFTDATDKEGQPTGGGSSGDLGKYIHTYNSQTYNTGGDEAHSHGLSGDDGSWRPSYAKCITASKD
jgi:microcystin-dependent protein